MVPPADPDALSPAELKALVGALLGKVAELERTVAAQREEIARLKGLKGRPPIKPSGMEQATKPKPPRGRGGRRRGKVVPRVAVVHGLGTWAQSSHPRLGSCDADVARASELQHAVEH